VGKITLQFSLLEGRFAVCRFAADSEVPTWTFGTGQLMSVTRTADELSIVCIENRVPLEIKAERGWLCLKLHGPFPFSETGILTAFVKPLSNRGISIFAISTFDTDYVLIKEESWSNARKALEEAGHELTSRAS
jgi:uncharacterized protein